MSDLLRDLKLGWRSLVRRPAFALTAIVTLALGLAAPTAILSVAKVALWDRLPYLEPERLAVVASSFPAQGVPRQNLSYLDFQDWQREAKSFSALAVYSPVETLELSRDRDAELVLAELVSEQYFALLGVKLTAGRAFDAEELVAGGARAVVLGAELWRERFGGDPALVGRSITLGGSPYTVVGVAEPGFKGITDAAQLWLPVAAVADLRPVDILGNRRGRWLSCVGRLAPGATFEAAQRELAAVAERLAREYPDTNDGAGVEVRALTDEYFGELRAGLATLALFSLLVLAVSTANVGGLLVASAAQRGSEVSLRSALGASRGRLARQMLAESAVLAGVGAGAGIVLAALGVRWLLAQSTVELVSAARPGIDGRVLAASTALALLVGLLFGLAPAWFAARHDLHSRLKQGGRGASAGLGSRLRQALMVGQVALALALTIGAGLMLKGYRGLTATDLGLAPRGVLVLEVPLTAARYADPQVRRQRAREVEERLAGLPGVEAVGIAGPGIAPDALFYMTLVIQDWLESRPEDRARAYFHQVGPGFFSAMGIPLLQGREFAASDTSGAEDVVVVSRKMAESVWPGESALGKRLRVNQPGQEQRWRTVVGVVGDAEHRGLLYPSENPEIYLPYLQGPSPRLGFVLKAAGKAEALAPAVRQAIREIDPYWPVQTLEPLEARFARDLGQPRFRLLLVAIFCAVGVFLAAVGLYGLIAYVVGRQRREIGLRIALGARREQVVRGVLASGLTLAGIGIALGLAAALFGGKLVESFLYGVHARDPVIFVWSAVLLLGVAAVASLVPALGASRVPPTEALRGE